MKNENTLLINTLNNTPHTLKKRSLTKKQLSINRVKRKINKIATCNFYITAQQKTPIIIKHYFNMFLLTYIILQMYFTFFISHILMLARSRILRTLLFVYQNAF